MTIERIGPTDPVQSFKKAKPADKISGNRLRVDFTFDFPKELPRPMPILHLCPVDKKGSETLLYIVFPPVLVNGLCSEGERGTY